MKESLKRILELVSLNKKIDGRKKMQKLVYILKQKGFNFTEDYTYYYYGPYSSTLQMEIDSLVDSGLLKEYKIGNTCEYSLSGVEYEVKHIYKKEKSFIKSLNKKSSYILELISVFFYLKDKGYNDYNVIKSKTAILKPELKDCIDEAFQDFIKIKNKKIGRSSFS